MDKTIPKFHAKTVKEWREWLRRNHRREERVYLVRYRKPTGKPTFNSSDAMDEAICFGWIDTTLNRVDDDRYAVKYVKRGKNSRWSKATLGRAERLIATKKMTKAGLAAYEEGKKKPTIDHGLPRNPAVPAELKKALSKYKGASENFKNFAPSTRRYYIWYILKAKRDETIKRRVEQVAIFARDNVKYGQN